MLRILGILGLFFSFGVLVQGQDLPSLYEYFATPEGANTTGLSPESDGFKLNGKPIRLISGTMHYFRMHPALWRQRLRQLRATGANAVETYVSWNLHEPQKDQWDFGEGDNDFSSFMNIRAYIQMAKEEDLLVILRPGPYICAEWEFGGHPSYLVRDPNMQVRTVQSGHLERVQNYLAQLLEQVRDLQFTMGGPIIAFQVENEYAASDIVQPEYLVALKDALELNGVVELLFTSDNAWKLEAGSLPELFKTINYGVWIDGGDTVKNVNDLLTFQPDKPVMVMEYWPGWFDQWNTGRHVTVDAEEFAYQLEVLFDRFNGSANMYLFHGGTNFGFNSGATEWPGYSPVTTSYDYDAPLTEAGDYTDKYYLVMGLATKYQIPELRSPLAPPQSTKFAFPTLQLERYLSYSDILERIPPSSKFEVVNRLNMEMLDMNSGSGQSQGYILYRKMVSIAAAGEHQFKAGMVLDFAELLVNGELQPYPIVNGSTEMWYRSTQEYNLNLTAGEYSIDLFIENTGRIHGGVWPMFIHHKGLMGNLSLVEEFYHWDGQEIQNIEIMAVEFKSAWVKNLTGWRNASDAGEELMKAPILLQSSFIVSDEWTTPPDTFIDMSGWTKGIVFVNGFNLGRYWNVGPTKTLYCPGPVLKVGTNTITIFEQLKPGTAIVFSSVPNLGSEIMKHHLQQ